MTNIRYIREKDVYEIRLTSTDLSGRRRNIRRRAKTLAQAKQILKEIQRALDDYGSEIVSGERLTFVSLAERYSERKLVAPVYKGETRISGLRSYKSQLVFLKPLVAWFGKRRIRTITHSDIEQYKAERFAVPVRGLRKTADGVRMVDVRERSVASVNRELSLLRALFSYAKKSGWLLRSPFEMGESLISAADEVRRDRLLTRDEESKLLAVCDGPRAHLRPLIICAVDTAMRRSEMFRLEWKDIDFSNNVIRVRKTTTKTWEARTIGMTQRLRAEFERMIAERHGYQQGTVFGIRNTIKRSFSTARRLAGIQGLRLHDLRHTATTRMIDSGMPPARVCKVTGHRQMTTFLRYMNVDESSAREAAAALDVLNANADFEAESPLVN